MEEINKRVIEKINREIGSNLENLHKCKYIIKNLEEQIDKNIAKIDIENHQEPSSIKEALIQEEHTIDTIDFEVEKINNFERKLSEKIAEYDVMLKELKPSLDRINELERLIQYMKIIDDIQGINEAITSALNAKDDSKLIGLYLSLFGSYDSGNSVIGRLENVQAHNLKDFAERTAVHWHEVLTEKFSKDFENILKTMKWAQQGQVLENMTPSKDSLNRLSTLTEYLLLIKSPLDTQKTLINITATIVCPSISIPTKLLLKQYRQRFSFHFTGRRQTNRLDKPEWYFTQILNWAKEAHLFVGRNFQQSAVRAGRENFNIRLEFIRGLVQLAIEKLAADIEEIHEDESLFAHLIDETLAFENELKDTLGYPTNFPRVINVITQAQYLLKWIALEERFSTDKMDLMLQNEDPWCFIDPSNMEDLRIPKCADQFIRLLDAIKDRYSCLVQPGHQLQFLNLQLELIDNFRRRLVQLHSCGSVSSEKILNTINYITSVLREWGENVHYLHLHACLVGPNADEIDSVFDKCVEELDHWQRKLLKELAMKIVDEIKAKSMSYRHDNWVTLAEQNTNEPSILSVTASDMFQIMMSSLHNLEKDLSENLFGILLRLIAHQLDEFFIDCMVMNTKFSPGGAVQFKYDMTRNLFPLFGQYIRRPDLLFKQINDACVLLNIPRGNALLLHETLKYDIPTEAKLNSIKEFGVVNLKPVICIDILERRTDIRAY